MSSGLGGKPLMEMSSWKLFSVKARMAPSWPPGGPRPVAMLLGILLSMVSREELENREELKKRTLEIFQDHLHLETLGTKSSLALGAHLPAQHCVHFASEGQVQGSMSS